MVFFKDRELGFFLGGIIVFNRRFVERVFFILFVFGNEDMWIKCYVIYVEDVNVIYVLVVFLLYCLYDNNFLKRDVGFFKKNEMILKRFIVYSVYLERYRGEFLVVVFVLLVKFVVLEIFCVN